MKCKEHEQGFFVPSLIRIASESRPESHIMGTCRLDRHSHSHLAANFGSNLHPPALRDIDREAAAWLQPFELLAAPSSRCTLRVHFVCLEAVAATNGRATILLPEGWRRPWHRPWSFREQTPTRCEKLPAVSSILDPPGPAAPEVMPGSSGTVQMMGRPSGMRQRPRKRHGLRNAILLFIRVTGSQC